MGGRRAVRNKRPHLRPGAPPVAWPNIDIRGAGCLRHAPAEVRWAFISHAPGWSYGRVYAPTRHVTELIHSGTRVGGVGVYVSAVAACTSRSWWPLHLGRGGLYISVVVGRTPRPWWLVHRGRGGLCISAVVAFTPRPCYVSRRDIVEDLTGPGRTVPCEQCLYMG